MFSRDNLYKLLLYCEKTRTYLSIIGACQFLADEVLQDRTFHDIKTCDNTLNVVWRDLFFIPNPERYSLWGPHTHA